MSHTTNQDTTHRSLSITASTAISKLEEIISQDEGRRGISTLLVPGDLEQAAMALSRLAHHRPYLHREDCNDAANDKNQHPNPTILLLSGFPCNVSYTIPTETDGPPGTVALVRFALQYGYNVLVVTDDCNYAVFQAALEPFLDTNPSQTNRVQLYSFPSEHLMTSCDYRRMEDLMASDSIYIPVIIACERPGPAQDGKCYTMRGIDMTSLGFIAPLHLLVPWVKNRYNQTTIFIAIGDGGNELGMGKVIDRIRNHSNISNGSLIGAVTKADYLITASVSNWGAYALVAAAAIVRYEDENGRNEETDKYSSSVIIKEDSMRKILPSEDEERAVLQRCVTSGARDGVTGACDGTTIDGLPFELSLQCIQHIFNIATSALK